MTASAADRAWLRPELVRSWGGFLLVSALLLAFPIGNSTRAALHGSSNRFLELLLNDRHLLDALFWESCVLALFLLYLRLRGWRPSDFRIGLGWNTSGQAVALLVAAWGSSILVVYTLLYLLFRLQPGHPTFLSFLLAFAPKFHGGAIHFNWLLMAVAMVVNAYSEELLFMGYIFNQIAARRGPAVALPVTILLRVACHTYQDPVHLAGIAMLFTVFAVWYWLGRKLWPLILAHILLDMTSFTLVELLSQIRQHLPAPGF